MYLDNLLNIKVKGQGHMVCVCVFVCMTLLEPLAWIHEMLHRRGPWAVLSIEQGFMILFY